jgi:hypothetical protein
MNASEKFTVQSTTGILACVGFSEKFGCQADQRLVAYYERNLPHWHPEGAEIFLTWCLHGVHLTVPRKQAENAGRAFLLYDRALDQATGPNGC